MDRLDTFLAATAGDAPTDVALRTLTLQMLRALAPRLFAQRGLAPHLQAALERCHRVGYGFPGTLDPDLLQAGIDAWFCRHLHGLPHPPPERVALEAALRELAAADQLLYAWLLGEIAARCGVDVRLPMDGPRPFLRVSRTHDAYFVTHLVLLASDYVARPVSAAQAAEWADALTEYVPWLHRNPNLDLAGEVAFCLRFLGRDAASLLSLVEAAPHSDDPHTQATALLALSVE